MPLVLALLTGLLLEDGYWHQASADPLHSERMQSSGCEDDSVDTVSSDGTILKTVHGHVYEIGADVVDVALWLPAEDLLVCPTSRRGIYKIINTDENNEVAYGRRLR
jgi:hypothetical protein